MDKVLRNTIIAGIVIVSLSVGYYFVLFLPKKANFEQSINSGKATKQVEKSIKEIRVGDEFTLASGRVLTVTEVTVGNYNMDGAISPSVVRAQVAIRIHSDGGPLKEEEYNKMYILKGSQLIKLSNSGGAYWGQYWFEMPETKDFEGMKLHFGSEAVITLAPYIKENDF